MNVLTTTSTWYLNPDLGPVAMEVPIPHPSSRTKADVD